MKHFIKITDLTYLEPLDRSCRVVGGEVYADTFTTTTTGLGYAAGDADAIAIGGTTFTNTQVNVDVKQRGSLFSSNAEAKATAYAKTGNKVAVSSSRNTSISRYLTNL